MPKSVRGRTGARTQDGAGLSEAEPLAPASPASRPGQAADGPNEAERARMVERDIAWDGVHYLFGGYRYTKLGDALNYARLLRERPELPSRGHAMAPAPTVALPSMGADEELMSRLGIELASGMFRFGPYRYDRLEDAVAFATSTLKRRLAAQRMP